MNKLIIDAGNTATKLAIVDRTKILSVQRHEKIDEETLQSICQLYHPAVAIIASVQRNNDSEIALIKQYVKEVLLFTHETPIPIRNLYATPETLGVDRLAAAVGANCLFPAHNCTIIDCGTAITIDFVSSSGEFKGGNISPGLQIRFKALHDFTGRLPLMSINENIVPIGTTTQEAIETGVLQGAVNELEGYMHQYSENITILTGGDAIYFAKKIKKPIFAVRNLNIIGLAKIADYNAHI
jgi:type III pantothenate kinase